MFQESYVACASDVGRAEFRFEHKRLELWSVIGRSVVVHDCDNADERFVIAGVRCHSLAVCCLLYPAFVLHNK